MKKIFMLCVAIALVSAVNAQVRVGVQAGAAFSRSKMEFDNQTLPGKSTLTGWKLGLIFDKKLNSKVSFAPELSVVQKGARYAFEESDVFYPSTPGLYRYKVANMFGELNLNLAFNTQGKEGVFAGFGPTISYGFSGKVKDNFDDIKVEKSTTVKFDGKDNTNDNNAHLKALEIGGNVFAGYRGPSGAFVKAFVNISGTNLAVSSNDVYRTSYFGLALGFSFGGK